ncbi:transcription initiation factor TFIID subunit 15 [Phtheirospermum japonicum]|uniref:Transcription initiation factor TFIID subunit 15 n=1 Tax=Phtheirospermum japonicum TaxID=374723 RepID=A0A830D696_9LAMI|nr:transcription initiation factor TFIID subunit 15 [Phtheirospermum japonicum]
MAQYAGAPTNGSVYVCNLPFGTDEDMLAEHFGTIGLLKKDKRSGRPKIWIYRDKVTNEPKGDATVTYEDPHAALAAIEWFNNNDFHGAKIAVFMAESKNKDDTVNHQAVVEPVVISNDLSGVVEEERDVDGGGAGRGRGRGDAGGKAWQQDGDWLCSNTSCGNVNFAFRGVCNRCGTARPAGAAGGGSGGGGRGRGRGGLDSGGPTRAGAGAAGAGAGAAGGGLFGPNDWPCPIGGRGGGYKELDEEELEETKRRRREAEEDDGEMYDEFGNLKKKFRAKTQQAETAQSVPGVGRAGWEAARIEEKEARRGEESATIGKGTGIEIVEIMIGREIETVVMIMIETEIMDANENATGSAAAYFAKYDRLQYCCEINHAYESNMVLQRALKLVATCFPGK